MNEGKGLPHADIAALLSYMQQVKSGSLDYPSLSSLPDYLKYQDQLLASAGDGWMCTEITVDSSDLPGLGNQSYSCKFHHRSLLQYVTQTMSNTELQDHIILRGARVFKDGKRYVCRQHTRLS
jgi:hypothetical protein